MAKPTFMKTFSEVVKHPTVEVTMTSPKTGNQYKTDVVEKLVVHSTGSIIQVEDQFKYSIVDTKNDLEYVIKAPNNVPVKFGTVLVFKNVRGGATSNGVTWFSADEVSVVQPQRNAQI